MMIRISAILLLSLSIAVIIAHLWHCIASTFLKRQGSFIPLIGGISGAIGMLLIPSARAYFWIPPVIDFGTIPLILAVVYELRYEWKRNIGSK